MANFTKQELVDSIQELKKINSEIDVLNNEIKRRVIILSFSFYDKEELNLCMFLFEFFYQN